MASQRDEARRIAANIAKLPESLAQGTKACVRVTAVTAPIPAPCYAPGAGFQLGDFTAMLRTIALATIVALLTAAAITLASKLPKPAAALEAINPAIVSSHLHQLQGELALP